MRFHENAHVVTADGTVVGIVDQVVVDPEERNVTHIVVDDSGLLDSDTLIPIDRVDRTAGEGTVVLKAGTRPEAFEAFIQDRFRVLTTDPPPFGPPGFALYPLRNAPADYLGWSTGDTDPTDAVGGRLADSSIIEPGAPVITRDGRRLGRVEEIVIDDDSSIEGIVARSGLLWFERHWIIPLGWISRIRDGAIHIRATKEEAYERALDHPDWMARNEADHRVG